MQQQFPGVWLSKQQRDSLFRLFKSLRLANEKPEGMTHARFREIRHGGALWISADEVKQMWIFCSGVLTALGFCDEEYF